MDSRFQPTGFGTYEPEVSKLTVVCNEETVGVVSFDLASYYGRANNASEVARITAQA